MEQRLAAVFAYVAAGRATVVRCVSIYAASSEVWAWGTRAGLTDNRGVAELPTDERACQGDVLSGGVVGWG
ncbi:hypothetical protein [Nocardia sp. NPDC005998]|uniref:hypothetical protein n=1 Tax=Nocardia sp. NPDC005998 TaxID=3156894 RepID=UPI0033A0D261